VKARLIEHKVREKCRSTNRTKYIDAETSLEGKVKLYQTVGQSLGTKSSHLMGKKGITDVQRTKLMGAAKDYFSWRSQWQSHCKRFLGASSLDRILDLVIAEPL
jgi:hypothetical protein